MMRELSLNVLDIVQNSIVAGASLITVSVERSSGEGTLCLTVSDNGKGMTEEQVKNVEDPFFTTRTTRRVGLGVPFFKLSAEMTGGSFQIESTIGVGTRVTALYFENHIDMIPLGDMAATMMSLISVNESIDFVYSYHLGEKGFTVDTREVKEILEGLPINSPEVLSFIKNHIDENMSEFTDKKG